MDRDKKYLLGCYEKAMPIDLSWREKFQACKESGFDFLEISIDETDYKISRLEWSKEERGKIRAAMWETGLPIGSICLSAHRRYSLGSLDEENRRKAIYIMKRAIDLAFDLGIRIIQLAGYDVFYTKGSKKTEEKFIEGIKEAAEMAAAKGIVLGFETMDTEFMNTVEKAMRIVNIVDSPYVQVYPDIGNLTNSAVLYGSNVQEDLYKGKGHIIAAHLKETVVGKDRGIPFGEGHTDFIRDIQVLKELQVRYFNAEFWWDQKSDWKEGLKEAHDFLRDKLEIIFQQRI